MFERIPSGLTWHLALRASWDSQRRSPLYRPESFADDGFIHCTDGEERLLVPANAYYRHDARAYVALVIELARVTATVRYDDDACIYPHIYGPLEVDAVGEVREARRAADGTFVGFEAV